MYTSEDRIFLMREIEAFSKTNDAIQGLLLVGSGATGFKDQYSDLDMLVVVKSSDEVVNIHEQLRQYIQSKFHILKEKVYRHEEDIFVTCFFFENYLELDLGIWSFDKLRATKPDWIVLFDRKPGQIESKLEKSLTTQTFPSFTEVVDDSASYIWQFFRSAAVALKREQYIKALKDIDFIRNQLIQLICIKEGINYDFDKRIDQIDTPLLQQLRKTYEVQISPESIKQVLFEIKDIYFCIVESEKADNQLIQAFFADIFA